MPQILFKNLNLLDPRWNEARGGYEVLVEGDLIKEVSSKPIKAAKAKVVDCGKRTLMPGLIDCHVHVFLVEVNFRLLESMPLTLLTATIGRPDEGHDRSRLHDGARHRRRRLGHQDRRRFRPDPGSAAVHLGPRHRSDRRPQRCAPPHRLRHASCGCCNAMVYSLAIADGPDAVRKAVREQMRQGADQVKIMCSGGVASPYDPLDSLQFSEAEIAAATDEAKAFGRYVLAHAYSPEAITRAVNNGVRTIEHGNLIDAKAAKLLKSKGGYMVANLVTYFVMKERAAQFGMSADQLEKNDMVLDGALRSLEICKAAGVKVGYGSDLLGQLQIEQSREFMFRAEVLKPLEIIRQATTVGAEILRQEGKLGIVEPGAFADLIVVDGNPLKKLELFLDQGKHLPVIMKAGKFHKNTLK